MAAPEHSEPAVELTVINNSSGVFPPPTRHWPGMTQSLTEKVPSSWETVQGCGKFTDLEADIPGFSPDLEQVP